MNTERNYQIIAEKYLNTTKYYEIVIPASLTALLRHMYTEEEAVLVAQIAQGVKTAKAIAKKVHRPVVEIKPILESLAKRFLIVGFGAKGFVSYNILSLYPLMYDAQMLICEKNMREKGDDGAWHKTFISLFGDFLEEFFEWLTPREIADEYQLMGVPFGRVIPIEQSIDATPGLGVMAFPSDRYSELVDRAKKSLCLVNVCTCRFGKTLIGEGCGRERNTCSTMGLPAEGAIKSGMGRRVSKEEFLDAKLKATQDGLVHMTENVLDPMLVCSCCSCCCEVMGILKKFSHPAALNQNHFAAAVDEEKCNGCKICVKKCPMDAITMAAPKTRAVEKTKTKKAAATKKKTPKKKAVIDLTRCVGCGVCVLQCDKVKAISLQERKVYTPPASNMVEFWMRHYFQQKGQADNLLPKLSLGVTRMLSNVNPIHITGPRAMSFKIFE